MSDMSLISPTVGLTSVLRFEADQTALNRKTDYTPTGGQIHQSVRNLYAHKTIKDIALNLTVPRKIDPDLRKRTVFEASFLYAFDKVMADMNANPAVCETLSCIKDAGEQCRDNIAAVNQA